MCGIVGYTVRKQAAPILLDSLSRLEYRGYDSAGLAVRNGTELAEVVKATGKLYHLADKTDQGRALAVLRAGYEAGEAKLMVSAGGLGQAEICLQVK